MNYKVDYYENPPVGRLQLSEDGYHLCYCQRGRLLHTLDGESANLTHGDIFLLGEGKTPDVSVSVEQTVFYVITFDHRLATGDREDLLALEGFLNRLSDGKYKAAKFTLPPEEIVFFESVLSKLRYTHTPERSEAASFCILSLLSSISEMLGRESLYSLSERFDRESFIKYCVLYVDAHCVEHITLEEITRLSATSRAIFCKLFKRETGLSFSDYLNRKRIQRALALIKSGEKITDVAYMCGYTEFTTFYRNFIKFTGSVPTKYRESLERH